MVLTVRILLVLIFAGSLGLVAIGGEALWELFGLRQALKGWEGDIEENKWGVGQVLALFAWTPWLIDLAYSGLNSVRCCLWRKRQKSPSQVAEEAALNQMV
jgi:hypothetical protein